MKNKEPIDYDKALLQMCDLCARSEQCEADLREKMRKKGVSPADAARVIEYLYEHNFLNEQRFARAYARDKHRFSGWGRIKIRLMLTSKRISSEAITEGLDAIESEEYERNLLALATSKARSLDLSQLANRQKLLRTLYARGYEPALIIPIIKRLSAR